MLCVLNQIIAIVGSGISKGNPLSEPGFYMRSLHVGRLPVVR